MAFPYGKDLLYQEDFMKKKFLFGLIALLSVSFIFFGCGDSGGGGGGLGGGLDEEAAALATELTDLNFTGVTYNSAGEVFLNEGGAVPAGETLSVPDGLTLVLPADQDLTVPLDGTIEVAAGGALRIAETATLTGDAGATIVIAAGVIVTGGTNFYDAEGEPLPTVAAGTIYKWDEDVDGEDTPGWKAQAPAKVTAGTIAGVAAPVTGVAGATTVTTTDDYTGTVTWTPTLVDGKFVAEIVYTATITLTPKTGYTFTEFAGGFIVTGVDEDYDEGDFTDGLKEAASGANWVVTAVFEATEAEAEPDEVDPVPGAEGALGTANVAATSFDVTWTKATDDVSEGTALTYAVYYSTTDFGDNEVATIEAGTAGNTDTDVATLAITGLTPATPYYFAVIVADEAGNKAAYTKSTVTTLADTTLPTIATPVLGTANVAATSFDVTWTKATDDVSEVTALTYFVYYSTSDFADNEVATIEAGTGANSGDLDIATFTITGLTTGTPYYFAVIVVDEAGNKAAYTKSTETTS
jgi:hypothetical protein